MNFDVLIIGGGVVGWRSQFATAAGSGTQVATDILTLWNDGRTTMIHDSEPK
jgi:anaerobic glycerol-3-phosphate dehydrogenase